MSDFLSDYLHKIAEAEIISHELVCHCLALCQAPLPIPQNFSLTTNPKESLLLNAFPFLLFLHLLPIPVEALSIKAAQLA